MAEHLYRKKCKDKCNIADARKSCGLVPTAWSERREIWREVAEKENISKQRMMAGQISYPSYLAELCIPVSSVTGRLQNLRSASRGTRVVPRVRTDLYRIVRTIRSAGFLRFGPSPIWNSLPPRIRSLIEKPDLFKRELKHYLMQQQS